MPKNQSFTHMGTTTTIARSVPPSSNRLANERAMAQGSEEFSVELAGQTWTQKPQKYHAKSLAALREKYAAADSALLDPVLDKAGCLAGLKP